MSDNVGFTPGTGAIIAADNVGGVLHQRVKLSTGPDGTATDVSEATPLPVSLGPLEWLLRRIVDFLSSPVGFDKSLGRARVTASIDGGTLPTVTTVGTVGTVNAVTTIATIATLTNLGTLPATQLASHQNLAAWAACCRVRIT